MAREKITEEVLKDGNIKVTVVFLATSKATSPDSTSGKMVNGYASGFMATDTGAKINIVYGWNKNAPKEAQPKPESAGISL
jgi:hypothetical protein